MSQEQTSTVPSVPPDVLIQTAVEAALALVAESPQTPQTVAVFIYNDGTSVLLIQYTPESDHATNSAIIFANRGYKPSLTSVETRGTTGVYICDNMNYVEVTDTQGESILEVGQLHYCLNKNIHEMVTRLGDDFKNRVNDPIMAVVATSEDAVNEAFEATHTFVSSSYFPEKIKVADGERIRRTYGYHEAMLELAEDLSRGQ